MLDEKSLNPGQKNYLRLLRKREKLQRMLVAVDSLTGKIESLGKVEKVTYTPEEYDVLFDMIAFKKKSEV